MTKKFWLFSLLVLTASSGCSSLDVVKAYQKGKLAKLEMQMNSNAIRSGFDDHTYFSKEASSGGGSFGGGGCGCN